MRKLIWPVLFLLLMLVQGALSVFYTGWLSCDLMLLALYAYATLRGEIFGAAAGLLTGFLQDAMTIGVFGFHMLSRACIGYFVGLTKGKVFKDNLAYNISAVAVCSLALRFVFWWVELVRSGGRWNILASYLWDTAGFVAGNMLLTVPMLLLVKKIYEWISEEDISY